MLENFSGEILLKLTVDILPSQWNLHVFRYKAAIAQITSFVIMYVECI